MIGSDLITIIKSKPELQNLDIKYTILYLLKNNLIKPSIIIDEYSEILNKELDKYKCQYNEACLCTDLILNGNKEQKDWAIKRAQFNSCNANVRYDYILTDKDRKECSNLFYTIYGINL